MKIYSPVNKPDTIGGGWSFYRNFRKGMAEKVHFVDSWKECDIFFITGITIVEKDEVYEAKKAGKKIVLRVDNVPRKSRNKRSTPHERLKEFAELSDVVIYQSEWAKNYCSPLCGDGTVIYNGVDTSIFNTTAKKEIHENRENNCLFAYHGKNEHKGFWTAHFYFQLLFRNNKKAHFNFIYDFGSETQTLQDANFDFWNGETFTHIMKITDPYEMAEEMRNNKYLIYPAICDASPNLVLEARACGMEVIHTAPKELSGTQELLDPNLDISLERMCEEYYGVFTVTLM